jgi:preprotein translocase subunit SecY
MQSIAYYFYLRNGGADPNQATFLLPQANGLAYTGFFAFLQAAVIVVVLAAGASLTMWLGERINVNGIGNGVSMILFAGIIARIPAMVTQLYSPTQGYIAHGGVWIPLSLIAGISLLATVAFIVWMDNAERRISVQYTKHVVGRKMYGGQSSHIPIKVNMSGVMPVIFASSILSLPPTIQMFIPAAKISAGWTTFFSMFSHQNPVYLPIYFILILGFAYFYSSIQYDPTEMSNNIRNNHGMIPGYRPGEPTVLYIRRILNRITLLGALLLSVVALFPIAFSLISTGLLHWTKTVAADSNTTMTISMGGTSIIIMVGVALETVKQLESQMMLRHYKGFLD